MPLPVGQVGEWTQLQKDLASRRVELSLDFENLPRFVAGADAAFPSKETIGAAAVLNDRMTQTIIETHTLRQDVSVPYIPGSLSFRKGPAITAALALLTHPYDAILFDAA